MKKFLATSVLTALIAAGTAVMAQEQKEDYLGLPGDNLNLFAVMKLFQESKTLEEFEKNLNDQNSRINNLDLNGDNFVDYISVFDNVNRNVHNIVMQVAVTEKERQDIAVFTVNRDNNGNVLIQLTGDEELYGKNYIIEPNFDDSVAGQTPNPGYTGNAATLNGQNVTVVRTTTVEIAAWPIVRYIYVPDYVGWGSSWYWGYYPTYWNPWRPFYWHYYYGYHYNWYHDYYSHYRYCPEHRDSHWHNSYYSSRHSHSAYVNENIHNGYYKSTYSHPEMRRAGEATYTRMSQDQNNRRSDNGNINTGSRRSGNETIDEREYVDNSRSATRRTENSSVSFNPDGRKNTDVNRAGDRSAGESQSSDVRKNTGSSTKSAAPESREPRSKEQQSKSNASHSRIKDYQPKAKETQSRSKEVQSKSNASHSRIKDYQPKAKESRSKSGDAQPKAKETQSRSKDSQSKPKESEAKKETRRK